MATGNDRMRRRQISATDPATEFSSTSIFITPMLDMSFQILAFFVFTYHPMPTERQLPMVMAAGAAGGAAEIKRPDQPAAPGEPALRPLVTVMVRARGEGQVGSLEVLFAGQRERIGPEGLAQVTLEELLAGLERKLLDLRQQIPMDEQDPRSQSLLLQTQASLKWSQSIRVMDSCRRTIGPDGAVIELFPKIELDMLK